MSFVSQEQDSVLAARRSSVEPRFEAVETLLEQNLSVFDIGIPYVNLDKRKAIYFIVNPRILARREL
jgi:hypothetical protein